MSGVKAIRYLLANNAGVTAVVPGTRIKKGNVKLNTTMPAISVTHVSGNRQNLIRINEAGAMNTDRVQVTVFRKASPDDDGYDGLTSLLGLVMTACASQRATVDGVKVDSISPDVEGPDLEYPDIGIYSRSRDFMVRWVQ